MDYVVGDIRLVIIFIAGLEGPADLYPIPVTVGNSIADNGNRGAAYDKDVALAVSKYIILDEWAGACASVPVGDL